MNRFLNIWGKLTLLCIGVAVILGVVYEVVSPRIEKHRKEILENLVKTWKKDAQLGKDYTIGAERFVQSNRFVRGYIPLRDKAGKEVIYVLRLIPGRYLSTYSVLAAYQTEGELLGFIIEKSLSPPVLTASLPSASLQQRIAETRGGDFKSNEIEAISGATFTFRTLVEALQEGSAFIKSRRREQ
jgi:Na+-translocating ferredoxin:NAD+ oxidoreductase RnfG subunit